MIALKPVPETPDRQMWRASLVLAALMSIGGGIASVQFLLKVQRHAEPIFLMTLVSFASVIVLAVRRGAPPRWTGLIFAVCCVVALRTAWVNHAFFAAEVRNFTPFAGNKILALTIGLVAPPIVWLGVATILATGIVPLVQWMTLPQNLREAFPLQEPGLTCIYAAVGVGIYLFRIRSQQLQRRMAQAEARAQLLQEFAHLLINAQHLANTPLQVLENTVGLLAREGAVRAEYLQPMKRSLARVAEVVRLFSHCDRYIDWQSMNLPQTPVEFEKRIIELLQETQNHAPWITRVDAKLDS